MEVLATTIVILEKELGQTTAVALALAHRHAVRTLGWNTAHALAILDGDHWQTKTAQWLQCIRLGCCTTQKLLLPLGNCLIRMMTHCTFFQGL